MPTHKGLPVQASKDTELILSALTQNGRFMFDSKVEGIVKEEIYMLKIAFPVNGRQEQMRQFYRVSIHLRIGLIIGNLQKAKDAFKSDEEVDIHEAMIENISGGGCRLYTTAPIKEGDDVLADFRDTSIDTGLVPCRVVRVTAYSGSKKYVSLRYWNIDERVRDKLAKYVFKRQLELRQLMG
jgi:c-di-GMP-binding flagellar brake protein YcgR